MTHRFGSSTVFVYSIDLVLVGFYGASSRPLTVESKYLRRSQESVDECPSLFRPFYSRELFLVISFARRKQPVWLGPKFKNKKQHTNMSDTRSGSLDAGPQILNLDEAIYNSSQAPAPNKLCFHKTFFFYKLPIFCSDLRNTSCLFFPLGSCLVSYNSTLESHNYSWDQILIRGLGIERLVIK